MQRTTAGRVRIPDGPRKEVVTVITKNGDRCASCGSEAPAWVEANDFDGYEDFNRAYATWEAIHEDCTPETPVTRKERPR